MNSQNPKKTFLEVLKVHNKEVPIANLLAFYFRPNEKHNLDSLFINTLLNTECYNLIPYDKSGLLKNNVSNPFNKISIKNTKVKTEVKTEKDKRIDILIETDDFVICIEFKINHDFNNPLEIYKKYIDKHYSNKNQYFVILTPYSKIPLEKTKTYLENNKEFKQIQLSDFIENITDKLPNDYFNNNDENSFYLKDFIQTIKNRRIRSKRHNKLNELSKYLLENDIVNEFYNNINGGFLDIRKDDYRLKIRINETEFNIEKWKNEKVKEKTLFSIDYNTDLKVILEKINKTCG
ncbi:PD-(D/E)XK nuclease family protein [Psychroserpens burtonensis]|uniref:PD-(D/E)XK nuclease family protein n=1 Tax=Psychroserpens burtonensis TaxID=49278 RepID=UPI00040D465E|nr:PD-(D/E)XK nuclease family protein [Psychroserpens burtonensis]